MQLPVTGLRPPWGAGGGDSAKRLKWDGERRRRGRRTNTTQRNGFQMTLISVSLTHHRSCPRTNQGACNLIRCSELRNTQNNKYINIPGGFT